MTWQRRLLAIAIGTPILLMMAAGDRKSVGSGR
jgi:hypothetical protein